ncbi:hypothetical protein A6D6_04200 [Alcanivorax xiamenensis]|uniref:Inner membrane protein YejM N-terminal domain-containing protein n=1 Tax=Alcanivorax xiamenensis TaxID=1177156 RepID=A0ABQ6Y2X7_9GAMM|nr:DUF3413 domain-containing protein [Alcanivorax xiamenensis]KAF0801949.1 hypothetical protein A6D6_04200 [Alcanivorax xiamenensis]
MTQRSRPSFPSTPWCRFFLINYVLILIACLHVARQALLQPGSVWSLLFLLVALAGYAFVFLLPPLMLSLLAPLFGRWAGYGVAVIGAALMLLLLLVDGQIHDLYGFHLNGFVWNLLTTPGGFTSMGAAYGAAHFLAYRPVLNASQAVPFYQPTTLCRFWISGTRRNRSSAFCFSSALLLSRGKRDPAGLSEELQLRHHGPGTGH